MQFPIWCADIKQNLMLAKYLFFFIWLSTRIVNNNVNVDVIVDNFALLSYSPCIVWRAQCPWTMVRNPNGKLQNALFAEKIVSWKHKILNLLSNACGNFWWQITKCFLCVERKYKVQKLSISLVINNIRKYIFWKTH